MEILHQYDTAPALAHAVITRLPLLHAAGPQQGKAALMHHAFRYTAARRPAVCDCKDLLAARQDGSANLKGGVCMAGSC
jgi:hypothetical protein